MAALAVAKLPFAVGNPRQVRDVAKAPGQLAKTDALDAGLIAHCAEAVRPVPRPRPDETTQQLDALLQRRRQLLGMLVAERHRGRLAHPTVRASLARQIDALQGLITATDEEVATILRTRPAWRAKDDVCQSAPGIGPGRSATLQAARPAFGVLNQREIAQCVGVAPRNDDRGKRAGARHIRGGRAQIQDVVASFALTIGPCRRSRQGANTKAFSIGRPVQLSMIRSMADAPTVCAKTPEFPAPRRRRLQAVRKPPRWYRHRRPD